MNLLELCQSITLADSKPPEESLALGNQFLNNRFLDHSGTIDRYPFAVSDRKIYLFLWNFHKSSELRCAICPYLEQLAFTCHYTHGQKTAAHVQDFIELAYVVKGELRQRILNNDVIFREGEFCLIDKNCVHEDYLIDNSSVILFLCLRNDSLLEIMNENHTTEHITLFLQSALIAQKEVLQFIHFKPMGNVREKMEQTFFSLTQELYENHVGSSLIIKGLLMRIFRLLSTEYEFQLSKQQKKDMNWAVFADVCQYMETNCKTVTLEDLAKTFHFQEDYFNRLIKKKTGKTYCEQLQEIRLLKAEYLLTNTAKNISEIAEEVGYRNKGFFYKIFTSKYGMTPAEYRKQL